MTMTKFSRITLIASSREASTRLSDEIGVKPCTRDEGTVGDS